MEEEENIVNDELSLDGKQKNTINLEIKAVTREQWSSICLTLSRSLEELRKKWFNEAIEVIHENDQDGLGVVNNNLSSNGECVIKGAQLYITSQLISRYIVAEDGRDFADLLWATVCGNELEDCIKYARKYRECDDPDGNLFFQLCMDIAQYITEKDQPPVSIFLLPIVSNIHLEIRVAIANAFGDSGMVNAIMSQIKESNKKLIEDLES